MSDRKPRKMSTARELGILNATHFEDHLCALPQVLVAPPLKLRLRANNPASYAG